MLQLWGRWTSRIRCQERNKFDLPKQSSAVWLSFRPSAFHLPDSNWQQTSFLKLDSDFCPQYQFFLKLYHVKVRGHDLSLLLWDRLRYKNIVGSDIIIQICWSMDPLIYCLSNSDDYVSIPYTLISIHTTKGTRDFRSFFAKFCSFYHSKQNVLQLVYA